LDLDLHMRVGQDQPPLCCALVSLECVRSVHWNLCVLESGERMANSEGRRAKSRVTA
jgi:hypothetical protein